MPPELTKIDRKLVEEQLERILASSVFRLAARSRAFLRYVVKHSLEDAPPKEYSIATEVLGRESDYDPAVDATVRVEAGRLRHRLREYYDTEGKDDLVVVEIPKGGYAAVFTLRMGAANGDAHASESQAQPETQPALEAVDAIEVVHVSGPLPGLVSPTSLRDRPISGSPRQLWRLIAYAAALALVSTTLGIWTIERVRHKTPPIQSLAVLPFENLSGDPGQEYFADGMTDELITLLAKNSSLRLVSRTSVMQYKGAHHPLPEIAKALGVDGILEGSISRSGDKIHVNVQLIEASSDTHVWAESYDRSSKDTASLPQDVALTIAAQLHRSVPHTATQRYVNPEAHEAYLRGRYYWFAQNGEKSTEYFKRATELQPDYALAWSGLAGAYLTIAIRGTARPSYFAPLSEEAASRALELDDSLSDAHNMLSGIDLLFRWDPKEALKESDRAIELDPQYGEAYFDRSLVFETLNRLDDALDAEKRSAELDPFGRPFSMPQMLFRMRNYDAAIREARLRPEAQPNDDALHWGLSEIYQCKGLDEDAAREYEKATLLDEGEAEAEAVRRAFERGGYKAILEKQLNDVKQKAAHQYVSPLEFAWAYVNLGRKDEALHFAEEAYQERAPSLIWIQNWPEWDFLHSDERYRSIVRRMGLPPAWR